MNLGMCNEHSAASSTSFHLTSTPARFWARLLACLGLAAVLVGLLGERALAAGGLASVTLAWDPSQDPTVVSYNLYYGLSSGNYTTVLSSGTNTTITVSNLTAGVTYYFSVTAVNAAGLESAFAPEITYVPAAPGSAPSLQITMLPTGQILVTANGQSGVAYDLLASRNGGPWQVIGTATLNGSGAFQFTDPLGTNATSCLYRLRSR